MCAYWKKSDDSIAVIIRGLSKVLLENTTLYRSPNKSHDCFQTFLKEFEKLLSNITKKRTDFTTIVSDFNTRSTTWWFGDIATTKSTNIEALTFYYGFEQVINEPTHTQPNAASCIDLIFADKPNLMAKSNLIVVYFLLLM